MYDSNVSGIRQASTMRRNANLRGISHHNMMCDCPGLQEFQIEVGRLSRLLLVRPRKRNNNNTSINSLLCIASPGSGKTLAAWSTAMQWCVFEKLESLHKTRIVLMLGDTPQMEAYATELPMFMTRLQNSSIPASVRKAFLDPLPCKKTILSQSKTKNHIPPNAVLAGNDILSKHTPLHVLVKANASLPVAYTTIKASVDAYYKDLKQYAAHVRGTETSTQEQDVFKRLHNALRKPFQPLLNMNAYIQTIIELCRVNDDGSAQYHPFEGKLFRIKVNNDGVQEGDLIRFRRRRTQDEHNVPIPKSPYFFVKRWKVSSTPFQVALAPLCNSSETILSNLLVELKDAATFGRHFQADLDNVLRFEQRPTVQETVADMPFARKNINDLFDLGSTFVDTILRGQFEDDTIELDKKDGKSTWWVAHGSRRPPWWGEENKGALKEKNQPIVEQQHYRSPLCYGYARRSVMPRLPETLVVGMSHTAFVKHLQAARNWQDVVIICDEVHQLSSGDTGSPFAAAGDLLRKAIGQGAKCIGFTATPYKNPWELRTLSEMLGGVRKSRSNVNKHKAPKNIVRMFQDHGVLVYKRTMTGGKNTAIMASIYPDKANVQTNLLAGTVNVNRGVVNYGKMVHNYDTSCASYRGMRDGVVNPKIDPTKYPKAYPFPKFTPGSENSVKGKSSSLSVAQLKKMHNNSVKKLQHAGFEMNLLNEADQRTVLNGIRNAINQGNNYNVTNIPAHLKTKHNEKQKRRQYFYGNPWFPHI